MCSGFVVNVNWNADNGKWNVNDWDLDDNRWNAGNRVFSGNSFMLPRALYGARGFDSSPLRQPPTMRPISSILSASSA